MLHAALMPSRRTLLAGLGATAALAAVPGIAAPGLRRVVPASGEALPALGLGTWITFNVGEDAALRARCTEVMRRFLAAGGRVVDSSPMYGTAEATIGHALAALPDRPAPFAAGKVWTLLQAMGPAQMANSRELWGVPRFDLLQVHNLLNWDGHLETLKAMKAEGRVRLIGLTTSHGRRHDDMERLMRSQPVDAVQFTYNVLDREAEARLLPLAAERGLMVLVNRPFRQGALIDRVERHPLPGWAGEIGCANWAQLLLKFILAHPAVTCAIPATQDPAHLEENMGALAGPLPDAAMRRRIVEHVERL